MSFLMRCVNYCFFAGVLPVLFGNATKYSDAFHVFNKKYRATAMLGKNYLALLYEFFNNNSKSI
jgi:hypothetical protein